VVDSPAALAHAGLLKENTPQTKSATASTAEDVAAEESAAEEGVE
jgi:hypothetical protein